MMNLGASSPNEALNESSIPSDKCIVNTEVEKSVEKKENGTISNVVGCELVEDVKRKTGLGHKQTLLAVESTLEFLINRVPSIKPTLMVILASVKDAVVSVRRHF